MIRGAGYTDIGKKREQNEDDFLVLPERNLYLVCDGVGGQRDGAKASHMVADAIRRFVETMPPDTAPNEEKLKEYFDEVLRNVNIFVYDASKSHSGSNGMATTLVLLFFAWGNAYIVNLGDSRAYLIRNGKLIQITRDHTYVNQLIDAGTITPEEAKKHPNRNMITKAVGAEKTVEPDYFTFRVEKGDWILLCSDGMYNEVEPAEIVKLASETDDPEMLARALIIRANEGGGNDNITAVAVHAE